MTHYSKNSTLTRRGFLTGVGATLAAPAILKHTRAYAANPVLKIGFVSPQTGPLAGFGEADEFVLNGIRAAFSGGIENNGKTFERDTLHHHRLPLATVLFWA